MTSHAQLVGGRRLQVARRRCAVRVVAVGAGHAAFAQRHVCRARERQMLVLVALDAELVHVGHLQKGLLSWALGVVHRVALDARQVLARMLALRPVDLLATLMAGRAGGIGVRGGQILEAVNGGETRPAGVTAGFHVGRARAVAGFAVHDVGDDGRVVAYQSVRAGLEGLPLIFMAFFTCLRPDVLRFRLGCRAMRRGRDEDEGSEEHGGNGDQLHLHAPPTSGKRFPRTFSAQQWRWPRQLGWYIPRRSIGI